jgi:hypothetical protein
MGPRAPWTTTIIDGRLSQLNYLLAVTHGRRVRVYLPSA